MAYHVRILAGRLDSAAGSHVYHRRLIQKLAARGHRLSVVCFEAVPEVLACAEVFEIPPAPYAQRRVLWRFTSWMQYRHCTRELGRLNLPPADVVFCGEHLFMRGHSQMFPQTPWIYFPHALIASQEIESNGLPPVMHWVTNQVYSRLQRWGLNYANRTVRFTRLACTELEKYYGRSTRPRFFVNAVAIDLPNLSQRRVGDGEVRLLCVGRLTAWKRLDSALSALSRLRRYRWRLDLVGEGNLRHALQEQVRALGLADRVQFHGLQAHPEDWYNQADLLLLPSRSESLGLVLIEAMSHGVPCLAMRADGVDYWNVNEEIIEHGRTGLLADGEAGFSQQLEAVFQQPTRLIPLGRAARRRVAEQHTWDKHLDRYEELFEELIRERYDIRSQRSGVSAVGFFGTA